MPLWLRFTTDRASRRRRTVILAPSSVTLSKELRTQVKGEPEAMYKAGESFYEAPNGVHVVSANASETEPATFIAYFVCDHNTTLSSDVPKIATPEGR